MANSSSYHHGIQVIEVSDGVRTTNVVATAIIGLVATGPAADAAAFPLNTPVLLTQPGNYVTKAGAGGTLANALDAIADQVGTVPVVVVRVEEGEDAAETSSNVIGITDATGRKTGIQALLAAEARLGVRPRILGAPGLDTKEVTTALIAVAKSLSGFVYAKAQGATIADAVTYAATFGDREVLFVWPEWQAFDVASSSTVNVPAAAVAMGLRAKIDNTDGVQKSLSNVLVAGVTGISQDVYFDMLTTGTDADVLNAGNVATLINRNGFRFWGSRTPAQDTDFIFENYTRTAQLLAQTMADVQASFADVPAHPSILKDMVASANAKLASLKTSGVIIDGKAWLDPTLNQATDVKQGKFVISYDYSPVPPVEQLTLRQTFTDTYFGQLATQAAA